MPASPVVEFHSSPVPHPKAAFADKSPSNAGSAPPAVPKVAFVRPVSTPEKKDANNDDSDMPAYRKRSTVANLYAPPSKSKGVRELPVGLQVIIYIIALAFAVFVLVVPSIDTFKSDDAHRRLGGGGGEGHKVITNIAYSAFSAGMLAYFIYLSQQPVLIGYLLGGVLVGPIGVGLIKDHEEILTISELGLIFLLFMIGLELDLRELLKMGKVVLVTGFCQFPICASIQMGLFAILSAAGLDFGNGKYTTLYVGMCCGISSTTIVVKTLSEKMETTTTTGRLTIGILIFQTIWAIIILAIQPNISNPEFTGILKTFGWIVALIAVSLAYSKFVLPGVLDKASKNNEMMLVLSLAWCFFVCCIATMSFVGLSMELAALIAGVSIATFPFSVEFNGKIKYIRDFFLTLYFVGLGMQIPTPTFEAIYKAVIVAVIVLVIRWVGIYSVVSALGGDSRLAAVATINLSEVSEFALVICSLGIGFGHVDQETMTIFIWTFSILAVAASYMIGHNHAIYRLLAPCLDTINCRKEPGHTTSQEGANNEDGYILFLGLHRLGSTLIAHFEDNNPEVLKRCHVIDYNTYMGPTLKSKNVGFSYGDIGCEDVLKNAFQGTPAVVLSTVPDPILQGVSNAGILEMSKKLWPTAKIVVTAERSKDIVELYDAGASYVLVTAQLSAEYLAAMLIDEDNEEQEENELMDLEENRCSRRSVMEERKRSDQKKMSRTQEVLGA